MLQSEGATSLFLGSEFGFIFKCRLCTPATRSQITASATNAAFPSCSSPPICPFMASHACPVLIFPVPNAWSGMRSSLFPNRGRLGDQDNHHRFHMPSICRVCFHLWETQPSHDNLSGFVFFVFLCPVTNFN